MSLRIITKLINFVQNGLNVNEKDVIVKTIKFKRDDYYNIHLEINGELYSIKHFEPLNMIQGVNYGAGPWYDCFKIDKETETYNKIDLPGLQN